MEDNRKEQVEALEVLVEFNQRVLKNLHILVKEISGERLDDTDAFMKSILNAMNWEIQVMNGTMELLNEGEQRVDKKEFNDKVVALNEAIASGEDSKLSTAFEEIIPYFENLGKAADAVIQ